MGTKIGTLFRNQERRKTDKEYRKKLLNYQRVYYKKNKEKVKIIVKEWHSELSKFKNHRCKACNKLLHHKTQGDYCIHHFGLAKHL